MSTIGTVDEFTIFNDQAHSRMVEVLAQNTEAFNAASRNTIRLVNNDILGDYEQETFYQVIASATLINHRDNTTTGAVADSPLTQQQFVGVKTNRRIGPIAQTLDSFKKIQEQMVGPDGFGVLALRLGSMIAKNMEVDWLNTGLRAAVAAFLNQAAASVTNTGSVITTTDLVDLLNTFGDSASRIRAWVMHSKVWHDLVKDQINLNVTDVSSFAIAEGSAITLNRPVVITDSAELRSPDTTSPTGDFDYYTLGLTENGIVCTESEPSTLITDQVTGLDNLVMRVQGEYAFNVGLKGYRWDIANGMSNPTDATIGTGTNWDLSSADIKDTGGAILTTK